MAVADSAASDVVSDCSGQCAGRRCGAIGACGALCGNTAALPLTFEESIPTSQLISREGTLHTKQDKIVITADGTIHLYLQLVPKGGAYVRSRDGGSTWEGYQVFDSRGWLGVIERDDQDNLYSIFASSWQEGGERKSSPQGIAAPVDKQGAQWAWTWSTPTMLLPHPPNPRHGFLDFAVDDQGVVHLVTGSVNAFSFDPSTDSIHFGINYFRSTSPRDVSAFQLVEQVLSGDMSQVQVPGVDLGYGGDPSVAIDPAGSVILVYSDNSSYQCGLSEAKWQDAGFRGTIYLKRYLRQGSGWTPTAAQTIAKGTYGDVDTLVGPDGAVHVVYTVLDSGWSYRIAYRKIAADGQIGGEEILTTLDRQTTERTIFPSLAMLDDGTLVIGFTDRLASVDGHLGLVVKRPGSARWSCAAILATTGPSGSMGINLYPRPVGGDLLFVYLQGNDDGRPLRFGRLKVSDLLAASSGP